MNKKEYEAKLNDLQNQIDELKNVKIEDDAFLQRGDKYWYVNDYGVVNYDCWGDDYSDNYRKDFLRIFKTKEECEHYLEIQMAFKEESKKFKPDWNDRDKDKYCLCYSYYSKSLVIDSVICIQNHNVDYFENREILENLIERFGEEDVKKYYLGIED